MIYLGQELSKLGKRVKAFCGVRSEHLLPLRLTGEAEASELGSPALCAEEFAAHNAQCLGQLEQLLIQPADA